MKETAGERNKKSYLRYLTITNSERLKSGKPVFPLNADDLIAYINYRAKTSTFRTIQWYIHSLHNEPAHGPDWKRDVLGDPRVTKVLLRLRNRDRAAGIPVYSAKKRPSPKIQRTGQGVGITKATNKIGGPAVQQKPKTALAAPQTPGISVPKISHAELSHTVQLDLHHLRQKVRLVNVALSLN